MSVPRTAISLALVAALALVLLPASASAEAVAPTCVHAQSTPTEAKPKELERAIRCLLDTARRQRKVRKVRPHRALRKLARQHARRMVATKCLDHRCPGEPTLKDRINRSGYVRGGQRFGYAEVVGYASTPQGMIQGWLGRRPVRRSLLGKRFTHVGIGVVKGAPAKGTSKRTHATYSVLLAWRR